MEDSVEASVEDSVEEEESPATEALSRALVMVHLVSSARLRCSAALSVLRHAVPPYPTQVVHLAREAEEWATSLGDVADAAAEGLGVSSCFVERSIF